MCVEEAGQARQLRGKSRRGVGAGDRVGGTDKEELRERREEEAVDI
jgi:hypothetical protein